MARRANDVPGTDASETDAKLGNCQLFNSIRECQHYICPFIYGTNVLWMAVAPITPDSMKLIVANTFAIPGWRLSRRA